MVVLAVALFVVFVEIVDVDRPGLALLRHGGAEVLVDLHSIERQLEDLNEVASSSV